MACLIISIFTSAEGSQREGAGGEEGYSPIQQESRIFSKRCHQTTEERKVQFVSASLLHLLMSFKGK